MLKFRIFDSVSKSWRWMKVSDVAGEPGPPGDPPLGTPIVRGPFEFAYDTPNLNDGVEFYTPTAGDILLDAWFEITEAWDGTTPQGDFGYLDSGGQGWYSQVAVGLNSALDMTQAWFDEWSDGASRVGYVAHCLSSSSAASSNGFGAVPNRLVTTNPLSVWVSQNGQAGSADPGATQGAARLYIVTATPVAFS